MCKSIKVKILGSEKLFELKNDIALPARYVSLTVENLCYF